MADKVVKSGEATAGPSATAALDTIDVFKIKLERILKRVPSPQYLASMYSEYLGQNYMDKITKENMLTLDVDSILKQVFVLMVHLDTELMQNPYEYDGFDPVYMAKRLACLAGSVQKLTIDMREVMIFYLSRGTKITKATRKMSPEGVGSINRLKELYGILDKVPTNKMEVTIGRIVSTFPNMAAMLLYTGVLKPVVTIPGFSHALSFPASPSMIPFDEGYAYLLLLHLVWNKNFAQLIKAPWPPKTNYDQIAHNSKLFSETARLHLMRMFKIKPWPEVEEEQITQAWISIVNNSKDTMNPDFKTFNEIFPKFCDTMIEMTDVEPDFDGAQEDLDMQTEDNRRRRKRKRNEGPFLAKRRAVYLDEEDISYPSKKASSESMRTKLRSFRQTIPKTLLPEKLPTFEEEPLSEEEELTEDEKEKLRSKEQEGEKLKGYKGEGKATFKRKEAERFYEESTLAREILEEAAALGSQVTSEQVSRAMQSVSFVIPYKLEDMYYRGVQNVNEIIIPPGHPIEVRNYFYLQASKPSEATIDEKNLIQSGYRMIRLFGKEPPVEKSYPYTSAKMLEYPSNIPVVIESGKVVFTEFASSTVIETFIDAALVINGHMVEDFDHQLLTVMLSTNFIDSFCAFVEKNFSKMKLFSELKSLISTYSSLENRYSLWVDKDLKISCVNVSKGVMLKKSKKRTAEGTMETRSSKSKVSKQ